ncbi:MAG: hypothetical protein FWC03_10695, partial [Treponema sp.]|nr:hypothetical protein [Treponema sp.]
MKKFLYMIGILVFFTAGSVFAQTTQELRIGSFLSGSIGQGQDVWYSVRATQAGVLTVFTESNIDTYLEAYDAQRNLITENDDGDDLNAKINILTQANTTYLFKLRGYSESVTGSFRIFADSKAITELRIGSPVSGNISTGGENWYSIRAVQNGILIVETSGSTDTYLIAYDEFNNYITADDDSAGNGNAKVKIPVVSGKTYLIALRGNSNYAAGAYRIQVSSPAAPSALAVGSFLNGNITQGGEYWYSVRAAQNGFIIIETSGNTDTYLEAYDENYNLIASDDDSAGNGNAKVRIQVSAGKTYTIALRGYSGVTTGAYRIQASVPAAPVVLNVGSFLNGSIAAG